MPDTFLSWQNKGAEGYIALGTVLVSLVEDKTFPKLNEYIISLGSEEQEQIKSHARAIFEDGTQGAVKKELKQRESDLWMEASERGIDSVLRNYQNSFNRDIISLNERHSSDTKIVDQRISSLEEAVKEMGSIRSLLKSGIVGGLSLGLFLALMGFVDNPLADLFSAISSLIDSK
ncbi:MAG: hypothetical protein COB08_018700 [Rhodobacteraceae bacterium]|nr:hypothetical protein [Paracoccaceae bacterium]